MVSVGDGPAETLSELLARVPVRQMGFMDPL
jgi:hypothetical protein